MSATTQPAVTSSPAGPLLLAGAAAGPLYIAIGTVEAVVRDGFDIRVHPLSLLANGTGGWVHSVMMVGTGLLTLLGAIGLARAFPAGQRSRWGVGGLAVFGLGVATGGLLRADPAAGFPVGTPDGPPATASWHGMGHFLAGGVGFLGLIVACLVLARWFQRRSQTGWAVFSLLAGLGYLGAFVGIGAGGGNVVGNLVFTGAVILGWVWITMLLGRAHRDGGLR